MLFHFERFARKAGAGIVVLLFHVFLLIVLRNGDEALPPSSEKAPQIRYMSLVPVAPVMPIVQQRTRADSAITPATATSKHAITTEKRRKPPVPESVMQQRRVEPTPVAEDSKAAAITRSESPAASTPPLDVTNDHSQQKDRILDYEAMKKSARESASGNKEKILPGTSRRITESQKLESAVAQSGRGDCASQHSQLGLLAIPFLLKDTLTDTGCKW